MLMGQNRNLFVKVLIGISFLSQTGFSKESADDTESAEKNENQTAQPLLKETPKKSMNQEAKEKKLSQSSYGKSEGLLGNWLIGPKIGLVNFPQPFVVGIETKYNNLIGASIDYGFLPAINLASVAPLTLSLNAISGTVRIFPFRGALFVGVRVGSQNVTVTETLTSLSAYANLNNIFITPHIGWRWVYNSGFFMGMELGWQFAMATNLTLGSANEPLNTLINDPRYASIINDVKKYGNQYGNIGLPNIALLQLGFLF